MLISSGHKEGLCVSFWSISATILLYSIFSWKEDLKGHLLANHDEIVGYISCYSVLRLTILQSPVSYIFKNKKA